MTPRRLLTIAAGTLAADQLTKAWIVSHPEWRIEPLVIIPGIFELVSWKNPGALFSLFADAEGLLPRLLLTALPACAILLLLVLILSREEDGALARVGYALVLGGAAGNLADRIFRGGGVIDFLHFGIEHPPVRDWLDGIFQSHWWPAFNVADSAICVGAATIAADLIFAQRRAREPHASDSL